MAPRELRIGTRGSALALWQARTVGSLIEQAGGPTCRLEIIKTSGDRLQDAPMSEIGGKRLFVREIEDALLKGDVDVAVHSSKDMPVVLPDGLAIAAALPREDPRDAVVLPAVSPSAASGFSRTTPESNNLEFLGPSPTIGTGSVRRIAQLVRIWPAARFAPIRGNLETRLRKLDGGEYDALVLAAAGLRRLGFEARISMTLPASMCVPAPGQGIVAAEIRADDEAARRAVSPIDDAAANAALIAERAVVAALGGGCQTPIGAWARVIDGDAIELIATVVAPDGSRAMRSEMRGAARDAASLGARAGADLMKQGAGEILAMANG